MHPEPPEPAIVAVLERHRWRSPDGVAAKCDRDAAITAYASLGGAVDRSSITVRTDGSVVLAGWTPLLPDPGDTEPQAERRRRAMALRMERRTWPDIAAALGYPDAAVAHSDVMRELRGGFLS